MVSRISRFPFWLPEWHSLCFPIPLRVRDRNIRIVGPINKPVGVIFFRLANTSLLIVVPRQNRVIPTSESIVLNFSKYRKFAQCIIRCVSLQRRQATNCRVNVPLWKTIRDIIKHLIISILQITNL